MKVNFTVVGEPKGKGRPRFVRTYSGGRAVTPKDTVIYENLVKTEYEYQVGERFDDGMQLSMKIDAYFGIPKSKSKKVKKDMEEGFIRPTKKPDMDNIVKIIADSLNDIAYHDDSAVVECSVSKWYSYNPRVEVTIENLN